MIRRSASRSAHALRSVRPTERCTGTADRAAASGVYLFRVTGPEGTAVVQRGTLVR